MTEDIAAHQRMRRCLLSIRDLDPVMVDARLREMDAAIARLEDAVAAREGEPPRARDALTATTVKAA